jgi:hypothetical protein
MMEISVIIMREIRPDLVSRAIMAWTGVPYSHIAIGYSVDGEDYLFHAYGRGVCCDRMDTYMQDHQAMGRKIVKLKCSLEEFRAYVNGAVGKDYSESQFLGFIFPYKWVLKLVGDGEKELVCSELVARVLHRYAGYEFHEDMDWLDPKEVWEAV